MGDERVKDGGEEGLPMPLTGSETQTEVFYRVSADVLATLQRELPKQAGGTIHFRQALGVLGVSMGRWLAVGLDETLLADAAVEGVFESLRKLVIVTLEGERERLAAEKTAARAAAAKVGN